MNKRQKHVQQRFLDNEEAVIDELEKTYNKALKDINDKIAQLMARGDADMQHVIYQVEYQKALKKQISGILDALQAEEFTTIADYLQKCYQDGFIGALYDIHGQGIPIIFPIDQEAVVQAVQLDSQISNGLYAGVGEDVAELKKTIAAEVSRGISTNASYAQVAQQIKSHMIGAYTAKTGGALYRAQLIARTEGHRVQVQSAWNACHAAKEKGADLVKQWDAALDRRTRKSHTKVDGEIRELDEPFSNGLMYPGDPDGGAAEVCNCRCAMLQRARWALDEDELETLKQRAEYYGLDKTKNFDDFKQKYLKVASTAKTAKFIPAMTTGEAESYAERFVEKYKSRYTGAVDYSGIHVDYANEMNRAFTEVFDAYEIKHPLRNIKPFNMREKRFKGTTAEAAYQWGLRDMFFNKAYYKTPKAFSAHLTQAQDLLNEVLPNVDVALRKFENDTSMSGRLKYKYLKALKKTGKTNVFFPDAYGSTIHEMGHYLDDELFHAAYKKLGFDLHASYERYAENISAYATASKQEYVAESFAAYWNGDADKLDPDLVSIFEGAKKK